MNGNWWLKQKYNLRFRQRMPVAIPNVGRNDLAKWCAELGFNQIVEVGVRTGDFTKILAEANPQARVFGIDPWRVYPGYRDRAPLNTQEAMDTQFHEAYAKLKPYGNCYLICKFSRDAVKDFDFQSIDMVYIDGNHNFAHVTEDIENWSRIVRKDGIIAGHDYKPMNPAHEVIEVYEAVNEYTRIHTINPWFVLGARSSHPGVVRDNPRSWMWFRS